MRLFPALARVTVTALCVVTIACSRESSPPSQAVEVAPVEAGADAAKAPQIDAAVVAPADGSPPGVADATGPLSAADKAEACFADASCELDRAQQLFVQADDAHEPVDCFRFYYGTGVARDWTRARLLRAHGRQVRRLLAGPPARDVRHDAHRGSGRRAGRPRGEDRPRGLLRGHHRDVAARADRSPPRGRRALRLLQGQRRHDNHDGRVHRARRKEDRARRGEARQVHLRAPPSGGAPALR